MEPSLEMLEGRGFRNCLKLLECAGAVYCLHLDLLRRSSCNPTTNCAIMPTLEACQAGNVFPAHRIFRPAYEYALQYQRLPVFFKS